MGPKLDSGMSPPQLHTLFCSRVHVSDSRNRGGDRLTRAGSVSRGMLSVVSGLPLGAGL